MGGYNSIRALIEDQLNYFQSKEFILIYLNSSSDALNDQTIKNSLDYYTQLIEKVPFGISDFLRNYNADPKKLTRIQIKKDLERSYLVRQDILNKMVIKDEKILLDYFKWYEQRENDFKNKVTEFLEEFDNIISSPPAEEVISEYDLEKIGKFYINLFPKYNYISKQKKLYKQLVKAKYINCSEPEFIAIFSGNYTTKVKWESEGGFREIVFLFVLLSMLTINDPGKLKSAISPILYNFIIMRFDFNEGVNTKKKSFPAFKSVSKNYLLNILPTPKGNKSNDLPSKKSELISIVKCAFDIKFEIPLKK